MIAGISDLATPTPHIDQNPIDINNSSSRSAIDSPNTDQNHIDHNIQHHSDFATPNPYACLAEQEQPEVDSISLENIENAPQTPTLQITPTRAPKNVEEYNLYCKCTHELCSYCQEFDLYCKCVVQGSHPEICSFCKATVKNSEYIANVKRSRHVATVN